LKKKKILFFCVGYPSFDRPANGIFTHRSVTALAERFELEVIHLMAYKYGRKLVSSDSIDGISVKRISVLHFPHFGNNTLILLNIYMMELILPRILTKEYCKSFDYFHSTMLLPTSVAISKLAKSLGIPHIAQGIGDDVNQYLRNLIKNKWVKSRFQLIDCFQLNSHALETKFRKEFSERANCFVLHRGVDLDLFPLKKEQDVNRDKVRFLYLGGVQNTNNVFSDENTKGIFVLLKAWSLIERKIGNAHLTIGGPGCKKEIFQGWLNTILCPEKISIVEFINPNDIPLLLKQNEVLLITSLNEGLPNLANEAQATGTVVLASNVGGIPETVVDGYSGFLFAAGDYEALAKNMLKMVEISKDLYSIGLNGRKNMEDNFSWQSYVKAIDKKFKEIK